MKVHAILKKNSEECAAHNYYKYAGYTACCQEMATIADSTVKDGYENDVDAIDIHVNGTEKEGPFASVHFGGVTVWESLTFTVCPYCGAKVEVDIIGKAA